MEKLSKHFNRVTEVCYQPASLPAAEQGFSQNDDLFEGPFETIEAPPLALPFENDDGA